MGETRARRRLRAKMKRLASKRGFHWRWRRTRILTKGNRAMATAFHSLALVRQSLLAATSTNPRPRQPETIKLRHTWQHPDHRPIVSPARPEKRTGVRAANR